MRNKKVIINKNKQGSGLMSKINIVLIEPQIHANTGNIARTCAVTGASLHLVKPLGFSLDDRHLKRAGLDYWHMLDITIYENTSEFFDKNSDKQMFFFTSRAEKHFSAIEYPDDVYLVFGKEDTGLSPQIVSENADKCVRTPMIEGARCLNLSNSVAIAVYEVLRQQGYEGLM